MERPDRRYVVVSGIPASGKSTLARRLSALCHLSLFDKDDILEALFDAPLPGLSRGQLSRASDVVLKALAETSQGAVITSFWRHPGNEGDSGTPCEWLAGLSPRLVEVHCSCPPALAVARFVARRRHARHADGERSQDALLAQFCEAERRGPLGVGRTITVETSGPIDFEGLFRRVASALDATEQRVT